VCHAQRRFGLGRKRNDLNFRSSTELCLGGETGPQRVATRFEFFLPDELTGIAVIDEQEVGHASILVPRGYRYQDHRYRSQCFEDHSKAREHLVKLAKILLELG
jgi:hypothetical protein